MFIFKSLPYLFVLQIYEGKNDTGNALHTGRGYTGSTVNVTIVTVQNLYIKFTTSAVGSGRGFKAVYSSGIVFYFPWG